MVGHLGAVCRLAEHRLAVPLVLALGATEGVQHPSTCLTQSDQGVHSLSTTYPALVGAIGGELVAILCHPC